MTTVEYSPDSAFTVNAVCVIAGQHFKPGDLLPEDSIVRNNYNRIQELCRQKVLQPNTSAPMPAPLAAKPLAAPVVETKEVTAPAKKKTQRKPR